MSARVPAALTLPCSAHVRLCASRGLVALDSGQSTGGFTDCLLQHGAAKVRRGGSGTGGQRGVGSCAAGFAVSATRVGLVGGRARVGHLCGWAEVQRGQWGGEERAMHGWHVCGGGGGGAQRAA